MLQGKPPSLAMAKVFGCMTQVWKDPHLGEHRHRKLKFAPKADWMVFLGVSSESKGWLFYNPDSRQCGLVSRDAFFHKSTSYLSWRKEYVSDPPIGGPLLTSGEEHLDDGWLIPCIPVSRDVRNEVVLLPSLHDQGEFPTLSPHVDIEVVVDQDEINVPSGALGHEAQDLEDVDL